MTLDGPISTIFTELLGIKHPVVLAGMGHTAGWKLAAAVSNAGGLDVLGGFQYSPAQLREIIAEMKSEFKQPDFPFGIDLLLPQIGGTARKTNHDYTSGRLNELIDVTIEGGAKLFVCAIGVPPRHVIDKLHKNGVYVMNMVGHPKHAIKALDLGVDMVCAQGTEAGGHTGDIASSVLIPAVVDVARLYRPPMLKGSTALVLAAGGIYDGRGVAAALMQGASAVWVGTRFVASIEANTSNAHKQAVVDCNYSETERTLVLSGRPIRVKPNNYIKRWEQDPQRIQDLCRHGIVPIEQDMDNGVEDVDVPYLMGQVAGAVRRIQPAGEIVQELVDEAAEKLKLGQIYLGGGSKI